MLTNATTVMETKNSWAWPKNINEVNLQIRPQTITSMYSPLVLVSQLAPVSVFMSMIVLFICTVLNYSYMILHLHFFNSMINIYIVHFINIQYMHFASINLSSAFIKLGLYTLQIC